MLARSVAPLSPSQDIEGTNGLLKHMAAVAPSIGWELLSARIVLKKYIAKLKTQEDREALIESCVAVHAKSMDACEQESHRFDLVSSTSYPVPAGVVQIQAPVNDRPRSKCVARAMVMILAALERTTL